MYCSNCGAEMIDTTCPACGHSLPPNARGKIDPTTGLMLAGYGRRFGQMFADELILLIPVSIIVTVFDAVGSNFLGGLAGFVATALYLYRLTSGKSGQTLGNRVAATRIRDGVAGKALSTKQVVQRSVFMTIYFANVVALPRLLLWVVLVVAIVDLLYPLYDERHRTLHDKVLGTIVVVA